VKSSSINHFLPRVSSESRLRPVADLIDHQTLLLSPAVAAVKQSVPLAKLSPIIIIDDIGDEAFRIEDDSPEGDHYGSDDSQLFAVGADVMMIMNLWTDAGLVNGACGTVVGILKPGDGRKARILMVDFPFLHTVGRSHSRLTEKILL
jgi:hypothetical protein